MVEFGKLGPQNGTRKSSISVEGKRTQATGSYDAHKHKRHEKKEERCETNDMSAIFPKKLIFIFSRKEKRSVPW